MTDNKKKELSSEPVSKEKDEQNSDTAESSFDVLSTENKPIGGALGQKHILEKMKKKQIVIHPFSPNNLQTCSYDVTLGENFYREKNWQKRKKNTVFIFREPKDMWEEKPSKACDFLTIQTEMLSMGVGEVIILNGKLDYEDNYILLAPGENILAHTEEFIGTYPGSSLTASCHTRSTLGRLNILTCKCAGWGDVGYYNRWTLEITNNSKSYVLIAKGTRIAQIVFWNVSGGEESDDYTKKGNYQKNSNLETVITNWKPNMMLPGHA